MALLVDYLRLKDYFVSLKNAIIVILVEQQCPASQMQYNIFYLSIQLENSWYHTFI